MWIWRQSRLGGRARREGTLRVREVWRGRYSDFKDPGETGAIGEEDTRPNRDQSSARGEPNWNVGFVQVYVVQLVRGEKFIFQSCDRLAKPSAKAGIVAVG